MVESHPIHPTFEFPDPGDPGSRRFDVIVVGLGAMGSAACYHLARSGAAVLGLEQFDLAHVMGSSGGHSRQTKITYYAATDFEGLIERSFELWPLLENETGQKILHVTGGLWMRAGDQGAPIRGRCRFEELSHGELAGRFPQFVVPENYTGMIDPVAGLIRPELAIASHCRAALLRGAELRGREPVTAWSADEHGARVRTTRGEYTAREIIFTGGPWTGALVRDLGVPLAVTRQALGWVWPREPRLFELGALPIWMIDDYYGFPMLPDYPGFKLALHDRGTETDPARIDREPTPHDEFAIRECIRRHIPLAEGPLLALKICMYTHTPDGRPLIGRHPRRPRVTLGAAFGGEGFKFSCAYGEALAAIALGREPVVPVGFLNPARFHSK